MFSFIVGAGPAGGATSTNVVRDRGFFRLAFARIFGRVN
jgi:hypothetical protein